MALPTFPQNEADYVDDLTDADFLNGGHRTNFIPSLLAALAFAGYGKDVVSEIAAIAEQVETDADSAAAGSGTEVSIEQIWAGAAAQYLSIRRILAANEPVSLTRAATTTWDMATGINFDLVLDGNVSMLANPTNQVAGKSGLLTILQDATGGRTLGAYGSNFVWIGGEPRLPTAANAVAVVSYYVRSSGMVLLTYGGDDQ